jgi:pfkB family carbohydrate kinase
MALVGLREDVELHTFHPRELEADVTVNFEPFDIKVTVHPAQCRFSFEYLHPLARPRIAPLPNRDAASVAVEADEVLRFGCLEGDFRVTAKRAVYDPQSGGRPAAFVENGSKAERLALVLNAEEIRRLAENEDIGAAAASLMLWENAAAIVVKDGAFGAYVFEGEATPRHVPAYPTRSVYKIGSGDVFSATFAHAWLSGELSAPEAADLASRRTADYVETPAFPLPPIPGRRAPASVGSKRRKVLLAPPGSATSSRWLHEEAIRSLDSLGATIVRAEASFGRSTTSAVTDRDFDLVLVIVRDMEHAATEVRAAAARGKPVVVFADAPEILDEVRALGAVAADELCSALYLTQWIPI